MDRAWKIYRGIYAGAVNQIETWLDDDTADRYSVLPAFYSVRVKYF